MSLWLAALMAASGLVTLPSARDHAMGLTPDDDYPHDEEAHNRSGSFHFRVMFGPDGKAQSCDIDETKMSEDDQRRWCKSVLGFSLYKGVRGPDGEPVHFLNVGGWSYFLPEYGRYKPPPHVPEVTMALPGLPRELVKTLKKRPDVYVNVAVDAQGGLTHCNPGARDDRTELAKLVCLRLPGIWTAKPERNGAGELVAYVRDFPVRVEASTPAN